MEDQSVIENIIQELDAEIKDIRPAVLARTSEILERDVSVHSLSGIINGKNNTYVDSVRTRFHGFNDFFAQWIKGLNDTFESERKIFLKYNEEIDWNAKASFRNIRLLQDEQIFPYAQKSLEKNFYKHLNQRMRLKPEENLWSIWFGYQLTYGLLIAPVKRAGEWTNDKSEIRRAEYNYWTIGHVLKAGLVDSNIDKLITFTALNDFYNFYESVLRGLSKSKYEQAVFDKYVKYLKASTDIDNEPFLIPEFRYKGRVKEHEYRLDFTVLNQHTEEFTGFEISPASSHMSVSNLKQKQVAVNAELKINWEKEMTKRNKFFKTFGITTVTFTDSNLLDIDQCFRQIQEKLADRPRHQISLSSQIERLNNF